MFFMLIICLIAAFSEAKAKIESKPIGTKPGKGKNLDGTDELGRAINLQGINLLADFREEEASIFQKIPQECFSRPETPASGSFYDYYENTKKFYSSLAVSAHLDVSLQSTFALSATLSSVISGEKSTSSNVSGISLTKRAYKEKILVDKDCLNDKSKTPFTTRFVQALKALPEVVNKPWKQHSWTEYQDFLNTFGSHVITSVNRGVSIKQTTFAQSSKAYSQREFQVKSCVSLSGPTKVGKLGVKACANVTDSEVSKSKNMNVICHVFVRGGTEETKSALTVKRTKELIEKLLKEASTHPASVDHTFRSVWDILHSRFVSGSKNYMRATNLKNYYLGFLNYGCEYEESGGVVLQKFDNIPGSRWQSPEFECTLASQGCHSSDDCHYTPIWCFCRGPSCVAHVSIERDTGVKKEHSVVNTQSKWGWHGCDWEITWSKCNCYNKNRKTRKQVWRLPSRDVPQKNATHDAHQDDDNSGQDQDPEVDAFSGWEKGE